MIDSNSTNKANHILFGSDSNSLKSNVLPGKCKILGSGSHGAVIGSIDNWVETDGSERYVAIKRVSTGLDSALSKMFAVGANVRTDMREYIFIKYLLIK